MSWQNPIEAKQTMSIPIAKLRWHCRRGMRELDVLLERYLQQRYPSAPAAEQQAFEALLELPDPQLFAYVMRREVPADPEWVHVIAKLTDATV
jgi:antitoxin CptB